MTKRKKHKKEKLLGAHVVLHSLLKADNRSSIQAVLLCKRTQNASIHPGHWALFGGKIESNELPEKAVRRELKQELEASDIDFERLTMEKLCDVSIRRENGKHIIRYFSSLLEIAIDELKLKRLEGKVEGEGLGWFTAEETHHLIMRPEDRIAVNRYFKENGI